METRKIKENINHIKVDSVSKTLDTAIAYHKFLNTRGALAYECQCKDDERLTRLEVVIRALGDKLLDDIESAYEPIYKEWNIEYEKAITRTETVFAKDKAEALKIATERAEDGEIVASVEEFKE